MKRVSNKQRKKTGSAPTLTKQLLLARGRPGHAPWETCRSWARTRELQRRGHLPSPTRMSPFEDNYDLSSYGDGRMTTWSSTSAGTLVVSDDLCRGHMVVTSDPRQASAIPLGTLFPPGGGVRPTWRLVALVRPSTGPTELPALIRATPPQQHLRQPMPTIGEQHDLEERPGPSVPRQGTGHRLIAGILDSFCTPGGCAGSLVV